MTTRPFALLVALALVAACGDGSTTPNPIDDKPAPPSRPLPPLPRMAFASCLKWGSTAAFEDVCVSSGFTILQTDGSERVLATDGPTIDGDPAWSPDGRRIAFAGYRHCDAMTIDTCNAEIYTMNIDGSAVARLTNLASVGSSSGPAWSPDGTRIAFALWSQRESSLYVVGDLGGNVARLGNLSGTNPAWSPDGSRIAFAANDRERSAIHIANADGSNSIRVTDPAAAPGDPAADFQPSWSPDGRRIAFTRTRSYPAGNSSCQVFVVGLDGSNPAQLTNDYFCAHAPAWSPDGTRISFNGIEGSQPGVYGIKLMNVDGSDAVLLRRAAGWPSRVAWAPLR